jgi:predicted restriction endonuclease
MCNVSKLDKQVWDDLKSNWETLSDAVELEWQDNDNAKYTLTEATDAIAEQRVRRGQSFFRRTVLAAYDDQCCVTKLRTSQLLRASHIVPWAIDSRCRLDPRNGLSMNALHDAAFDRGLMTIDKEYRVVFSNSMVDQMPPNTYKSFFAEYAGQEILLPDRFVPDQSYLQYHRDNIFQN